jgi:TRAP-type C4-dicarboxylate transport system permease large subunit
MLKSVLWSTSKTVGSLYLIVIGASVFNFLITITQLPFTVVAYIDALQLSQIGLILVIFAIYLVLGSLMDSLAMLFLTIPVFFPVVVAAGIDPIWFGVFAVLVVEIGMISPPVGMNLFVIQGVLIDIPLKQIWVGTVPFLLADIVRIALLIAFPSMCLFLVTLAR